MTEQKTVPYPKIDNPMKALREGARRAPDSVKDSLFRIARLMLEEAGEDDRPRSAGAATEVAEAPVHVGGRDKMPG